MGENCFNDVEFVAEELARYASSKETMLTIGGFDGVHRGHQHLILHMLRRARERGLRGGVITFQRHPRAVLNKEYQPGYLLNLEERIALIKKLGVDMVLTLTFSEHMARLPAKEFVILLWEHLKVRGLVVGPDFAFGHRREGNTDKLREFGKELGFTVEVVPPLVWEGMVVSSTSIREALAEGDLPIVKGLLGRPLRLDGVVMHGDERGRTLGFPTANLYTDPERTLPANGVYAAWARVKDEPVATRRQAAAYVGRRPTFGGGERMVEVYLLDFTGDLYGKELEVEMVERLRPDAFFSSIEELKARMLRDIERARSLLVTE